MGNKSSRDEQNDDTTLLQYNNNNILEMSGQAGSSAAAASDTRLGPPSKDTSSTMEGGGDADPNENGKQPRDATTCQENDDSDEPMSKKPKLETEQSNSAADQEVQTDAEIEPEIKSNEASEEDNISDHPEANEHRKVAINPEDTKNPETDDSSPDVVIAPTHDKEDPEDTNLEDNDNIEMETTETDQGKPAEIAAVQEDTNGSTDENANQSEADDVDAKMETSESNDGKPTSDAEAGENGSDKETLKPIKSRKGDPQVLDVRRRIQMGCKDNDLESAMKVYDEAVRDDIRLEAQSFYNLLNLCDGLERSVHVGTPKGSTADNGGNKSPPPSTPSESSTIDNATRQEYAFRIMDHMKKLDLPLNETAYTAVVKVLVRNQEFEKAEEILNEAESVQQCKPKLRLYASLLVAYCENRQMIDALKCWNRISKQKLELTEKELLALIRCASATGDVPVLERVLSDLAESIAVPSKDTVSAILQWFESPHAMFHEDPIRVPKQADVDEVKTLLHKITKDEVEPPPSMGPVQTKNGWTSSASITVDPKSGILQHGCLADAKLLPVPLSERAWEEMLTMNETIVLEGKVEGHKSVFQGGKKGQIRTDFDPEKRKIQWGAFTDFLKTIDSIDIVIDAANVGYYKQNFAASPNHVEYEQLDQVARKLEAMGKKILLVLHQRHFSPKLMPSCFKPLQEDWEKRGILYKTPAGMNDDWFWLHAALKYRAQVLTNDEMRDHHFQMLAPRTFLRWKERNQVHFFFGEMGVENGESSEHKPGGRDINFEFPKPYSRRIQRLEDEKGLVVPLIKKGDENRFLDGTHVADDDEPKGETYLCIRAAAASS